MLEKSHLTEEAGPRRLSTLSPRPHLAGLGRARLSESEGGEPKPGRGLGPGVRRRRFARQEVCPQRRPVQRSRETLTCAPGER